MMLQIIAPTTGLLLVTIMSALASNTLRHLSPPQPSCATENGFDYQGNDIKNIPNSPVERCCDACKGVAGCNAWSWSDFNNGTCWLKSAQGKIIVNANVKSSPLYQGYHMSCYAADNVDFMGNDIGNVQKPNVDDCCSVCQNTLGCRAYSWSGLNGGTCWLKSARGQAIVKKGVKSAVAYPDVVYQPLCALNYDVDIVGNDIGSTPSSSPTGCCDICYKRSGCAAYSWTNLNGGTCWLKSVKVGTVKKAGVVSAGLNADPPFTCKTESGIDYPGNDITNIPSVDPDACCALCYQNAYCKVYTWSDYNGGTCWLKSAKGTAVAKANVISGAYNYA